MNQKDLLALLQEVPDYRRGNAIKHNFYDVLVIGLLTILCNGDTFTDMEYFGNMHENTLKEFLELPHGIPSHDTFEDIFCQVDSKALQRCFDAWLIDIKSMLNNATISIDGKTIRGSKSKQKRSSHIVTAFANQAQLVLGQVSTDEKSNEITAIPELLDLLEIKGSTVTIDAMGTQTAIATKIVEKGGDYVLMVKENQKTLYDDIALYFDTEIPVMDKVTQVEQGLYHKTIEKGHGRIETRECYICKDIDWLDQQGKWTGISGIGVIKSKREIIGSDNPASTGLHYFIFSNKEANASTLLQQKREHWAIENSLHWLLDVAFHEDACRTRLERGAENLNTFRKLALQLLKQDQSRKASMKSKRWICSMDLFYAFEVLGVKKIS